MGDVDDADANIGDAEMNTLDEFCGGKVGMTSPFVSFAIVGGIVPLFVILSIVGTDDSVKSVGDNDTVSLAIVGTSVTFEIVGGASEEFPFVIVGTSDSNSAKLTEGESDDTTGGSVGRTAVGVETVGTCEDEVPFDIVGWKDTVSFEGMLGCRDSVLFKVMVGTMDDVTVKMPGGGVGTLTGGSDEAKSIGGSVGTDPP